MKKKNTVENFVISRLESVHSLTELLHVLQKAGHFIDTIASCTEATLQDEDVIFDQLKEYLFYTSSIDVVYKHHDRLYLQIENLKTSVRSKIEESERIQQGIVNILIPRALNIHLYHFFGIGTKLIILKIGMSFCFFLT